MRLIKLTQRAELNCQDKTNDVTKTSMFETHLLCNLSRTISPTAESRSLMIRVIMKKIIHTIPKFTKEVVLLLATDHFVAQCCETKRRENMALKK